MSLKEIPRIEKGSSEYPEKPYQPELEKVTAPEISRLYRNVAPRCFEHDAGNHLGTAFNLYQDRRGTHNLIEWFNTNIQEALRRGRKPTQIESNEIVSLFDPGGRFEGVSPEQMIPEVLFCEKLSELADKLEEAADEVNNREALMSKRLNRDERIYLLFSFLYFRELLRDIVAQAKRENPVVTYHRLSPKHIEEVLAVLVSPFIEKERAPKLGELPSEQLVGGKIKLELDEVSEKDRLSFPFFALSRIIINLFKNACEHGKIPVEVKIRIGKDKAELSVTNPGEYLRLETVEEMFDIQKNLTAEGPHLGLATVQRLVRAVDGNISFQSKREEDFKINNIINNIISLEIPLPAKREKPEG